MKKKGLYTVVLLLVSAIGLHAQEHVDTTVIRPHPAQMNVPLELVLPVIPLPALEQPESKEEQAARINKETYLRVMASVNQSLAPLKPPHLSNTQKALLLVGSLFLTSPYKFRDGTVPVMNASNPNMFLVTPGKAPYDHPYSPEAFPQCIKTEFDFATGTYKQVMVK